MFTNNMVPVSEWVKLSDLSLFRSIYHPLLTASMKWCRPLIFCKQFWLIILFSWSTYLLIFVIIVSTHSCAHRSWTNKQIIASKHDFCHKRDISKWDVPSATSQSGKYQVRHLEMGRLLQVRHLKVGRFKRDISKWDASSATSQSGTCQARHLEMVRLP